jgi:hypothetical protein
MNKLLHSVIMALLALSHKPVFPPKPRTNTDWLK